MLKQCSRCSMDFECKSDDIKSCHCSSITLSNIEAKHLSSNFNDCLCKKCLKEEKELINKAENA